MNIEYSLFILGCLQLLVATLGIWVLRTLVSMLEKVSAIEAELKGFPLAQIQDNTRRIGSLEVEVARIR